MPEPSWRPIATAPKDGSAILVAGGTWWEAWTPPQPHGTSLVRWDGDRWSGRGEGTDAPTEYDPEVWMPVPVYRKRGASR